MPSIEELKFAEKVLDRVYQRLLDTGIFRGEQRKVFHEEMNHLTGLIKSTNEPKHPEKSV
jgi:hypothetical protein